MAKNKIFVFGVDGATFTVLDPLMNAGRLPTFKRVLDDGVSYELRTVIPPVSTTAWCSFVTGLNPGKHGVLDFTSRLPQTWQTKPVTSRDRAGPAIWNMLSKMGKSVGIVNVPCTYPPEPVRGFMISGFPLPDRCDDYTYPKELSFILKQKGWVLSDIATQSYSRSQFESFLQGLYRRLRARTEAVVYLIKEYDPDFTMVHVLETDKIQHEFWKFMEAKGGKNPDPLTRKYGTAVEDFFVSVDNNLKILLNQLDEDTTVLIASDHGFCSSRYFVYPNNWLLNQGYISLKKNLPARMRVLVFRLGLTPSFFFKLLPDSIQADAKQKIDSKYHEKASASLSQWIVERVSQFVSKTFFLAFTDIDWNKTSAYAMGNSGIGQIYVNIQGSKWSNGGIPPESSRPLRRELISNLRKLSHGGDKLVDEIYQKDEIYSGPFLDNSADILFTFKNFNYTSVQTSIFSSNKVVERNYFARGDSSHNMIGILMMSGPRIKNEKTRLKADIIDVMPTILYLMGIASSDQADGRVLEESTNTQSAEVSMAQHASSSDEGSDGSRVFTKEEEESMMESLRRMGYV